jgi:hypothetical protein
MADPGGKKLPHRSEQFSARCEGVLEFCVGSQGNLIQKRKLTGSMKQTTSCDVQDRNLPHHYVTISKRRRLKSGRNDFCMNRLIDLAAIPHFGSLLDAKCRFCIDWKCRECRDVSFSNLAWCRCRARWVERLKYLLELRSEPNGHDE